MKKPVWIIVILVALFGGFDAARPLFSGRNPFAGSTSIIERTEFWGFVAFVIICGITVFCLKWRSKK